MDKLIELVKQLKSKTVWGGFVIAAAQLDTFSDYRAQLMTVGIALLGVGVSHKLDKIKDATKADEASESE